MIGKVLTAAAAGALTAAVGAGLYLLRSRRDGQEAIDADGRQGLELSDGSVLWYSDDGSRTIRYRPVLDVYELGVGGKAVATFRLGGGECPGDQTDGLMSRWLQQYHSLDELQSWAGSRLCLGRKDGALVRTWKLGDREVVARGCVYSFLSDDVVQATYTLSQEWKSKTMVDAWLEDGCTSHDLREMVTDRARA